MATTKSAASRRTADRTPEAAAQGSNAKKRQLGGAERPVDGSDAWWRPLLRGQRSFASLYSVAPIKRVHLVERGVPAEALGDLAHAMGIAKEKLYATLGLPRATMDRKARQQQRLSQDESERVVGLARLIGQVEQLVYESSDVESFSAARWVATWLDRPLPALGGLRPASLMTTAEGREIVAGLVAQMQSGAYA